MVMALTVAAIVGGWIYACNNTPAYNVVVVFSHYKDLESYDEIRDAMYDRFKKDGNKIRLNCYYLDCERWDSKQEEAEATRILEDAAQGGKIDMIVTVGDQASFSVMQVKSNVVHDVPVVFGGVIYPNKSILDNFPNYTGIVDSIDIPRNIYAAKKLTGLRNTFTMLTETFLDRQTKRNIVRQIEGHDNITNNLDWHMRLAELNYSSPKSQYSITPFSIRNMDLNTAEKENKNELGASNLIYVTRRYSYMVYIQMKYDIEDMSFIRFCLKKPMVTAIGTGFGIHGSNFIGGYFASSETVGNDIAERVLKIFHGAKPQDLPLGKHKKKYYIDWEVAKYNGFTLSNLPKGYNVVNLSWKEANYTLYITLIWSGIVIVTIGFIVLLYLNRRQRQQKKRMRQQLERENTLYNMAVHNSLTFAAERTGDIFYFASSFWEYYGKEPHDIHIDDFMQMLHPDSREHYRSSMSAFNGDDVRSTEVQADFGGTGTYHWFMVRARGTHSQADKLSHSYGIIMNIDEIKQREQELIEARRLAEEAKLKDSFLANMSHEIRTPLNAIVGFSDLLATPGMDFSEDEKAEFLGAIHVNNDLLLKLVNDILDITRIDSGQLEFTFAQWDVSELMTRVQQSFSVQAPEGVAFNFVKGADAKINIDIARMQQVLSNFLTNAKKFTKQGSITLGWAVDEARKKVELYVEDTGIGMSADDCKMVFIRFYKKNEYVQGTGLGLSICKSIVEHHGGTVTVQSELGKGSRFSVFLDIL